MSYKSIYNNDIKKLAFSTSKPTLSMLIPHLLIHPTSHLLFFLHLFIYIYIYIEINKILL